MFNMDELRRIFAIAMSDMAKEIMPKDERAKEDPFAKNECVINEKRTQSTVNVNRMNVDSSCLDVEISVADVSDIEVTIKGDAKKVPVIEFTTEVVEKEFCVKTRMRSGTYIGCLYLEILVPKESRFKRISVESSTGDIEVSDKILVEELNVNTASGDVFLEKLRDLSSINIKTSTGDVEVSDYVETNFLKIQTFSGEVEVSDDISADEVEISTSTGDINLSDTFYSKNIRINTSSGEVDISKLIASGEVYVETSTGDVGVADTKADSFKIKTISGEIDVDAEFVKAYIDTKTADITVNTTAKQNIQMDISSRTGDVSIDLYNIKSIKQIIQTQTGDTDCSCKGRGECTADVRVTTATGDIEIS